MTGDFSGNVNGFGAGFRVPHYSWITENRPQSIDFFEVVSENFMGVGGRPRAYLEKLRADYPVSMHGVGLSIGSDGTPTSNYLKKLRDLIDRTQPTFVSDHLCWTTYRKKNSHDLLPVSYTNENLSLIAERVDLVQNAIGQRLYLENPSAYVSFNHWDYLEAQFFAELIRKSGAGILLDVNNLYVNQRNLNLDPISYLELIQPKDVCYLHLAGHTDNGNVLIDTHDGPVCDDVWNLYKLATERFPDAGTLIEWDENIPDFAILEQEVARARAQKDSAAVKGLKGNVEDHHASNRPQVEPNGTTKRSVTCNQYELFFNTISKADAPSEESCEILVNDAPTPAMTGLSVYHQAYFLRLRDCIADTFPALKFICDEEGFSALIADYLPQFPPASYTVHGAGQNLELFLRTRGHEFDFGVPETVLADIAAIEWSMAESFIAPNLSHPPTEPNQLMELPPVAWQSLRVAFTPAARVVNTSFDVWDTIRQARDGTPPDRPTEVNSPGQFWLISRKECSVSVEKISSIDGLLWEGLSDGLELFAVCESISLKLDLQLPEIIEKSVAALHQFCQKNLVAKLSHLADHPSNT